MLIEEAAEQYRKSSTNKMYIEKYAFIKGAEYQSVVWRKVIIKKITNLKKEIYKLEQKNDTIDKIELELIQSQINLLDSLLYE